MAHKNSRNFSFIGKNIKKIRRAKNISQSAFASLFNLGRPSVGAYEEERAEPKVETIIAIAQHFNLSIDLLLMRELSSADILSIGLLNKKLDKAHRGKLNAGGNFAPLVRIADQVDYIVNIKNPSFADSLPRVSVNKTDITRIFEHQGSEMSVDLRGINHGDLIYCSTFREIPDTLVTVVTNERVLIRRLKRSDNNKLVLTADNSHYSELQLEKGLCLEIWSVVGIYSEYLSKPSDLEKRLQTVEGEIRRLKQSGS